MLNDEQKNEAVLIASVGCDRETVASYLGCNLDEMNVAAIEDPDFAKRYRRAEAGCELAHMRAVQQAAKDEKNWRASVWWLERRLPERYGKRGPGTVGRRDLVQFLKAVATGIAGAVQNDDDRQRVIETLQGITGKLTDPLSIEQAEVDSEEPHDEEAA